jgi:uncharacterized membrane protein
MATIDRMVTSLTQHELSEDSHDLLATHLLRTAHGLTGAVVLSLTSREYRKQLALARR